MRPGLLLALMVAFSCVAAPLAPAAAAQACGPVVKDKKAAVVFLGEDSITKGEWQGRYGSEGYILSNYLGNGKDVSSPPAFLHSHAYSQGTQFYVWNGNTTDARAPAPVSGNRVAATSFHGTSFSLTLNVTDDAPHILALYLVDWDGLKRSEDVIVYSAATDEVLDRRSLRNFRDGIYYVYQVQGSVRIEFERTGPHNSLLSGVFWDPLKPATEAGIKAAIKDIGGGQKDAVFAVRRGGETLLFNVTGAAGEGLADSPQGVTGRYITGPGYGRLLDERRDAALGASWWRPPADGFPGEETAGEKDSLWAEWEGEILVGRDKHRFIPLAGGQSLGITAQASDDGVCVQGVDPGGPAEAGGLQAGDLITQVVGSRIREKSEVTFRLDAPKGGHVFIDGLRLLSKIPCGEPGLVECTNKPRLEATLKLPAGKRQLRMAAVRRGSEAAEKKAKQPEEPPAGPLLSWKLAERIPEMKDFEPVPSSALHAATGPGTWTRTPRQAAQMGLEWLQSAGLDWQKRNNCYGCHSQAQALQAMAIARDNDYTVSAEAYDGLLKGIASFQRTDNGSWHNSAYITSAQFGAMALATAHQRGKEGRNENLLRAVRFLMKAQKEDGRVPLDHNEAPIDQGDILATANSRIAFSVAAQVVPPKEAAAIREAEKKALSWLASKKAKTVTNQDRAMKALGLATENREDRNSVREELAAAKDDLLEHQLEDGGWAEQDKMKSNAFATGQALYAAKMAGQSIASVPFQRGVDWLLANQLWTGAWAQKNTRSHRASQYAATMWPVIALVGSFQAVGMEIAEPIAGSCLDGEVRLAARIVSNEANEPVEQVRFLVDGQVVGTANEAAGEGLFGVSWNAGTVEPGIHEVRAEAMHKGDVRGEDQTEVNIGPVGSRCSGTLSVASTGEPIAGISTPNIELILDASGSMREKKRKINGRLKIDVAKDVLGEIIKDLPDGISAGLRVYGQSIREGREGDCKDSELLLPFGRIDKARMSAEARKVRALGTTPLAYSLVQAARDLAAAPGGKLIILVTDGKEECGGKPREVAAKLVEHGMDLRVDVVGFALAEEAVKEEMIRVAEITEGSFFDAQNAEELLQAIRHALAAPYDVFDAAGNRAGGGVINHGTIEVPKGVYNVVVRAVSGEITIPNVVVAYDQATWIGLAKKGTEIKKQILGPVAKQEASWAAEAVAVSREPPVAVSSQNPEQLARLKEALDGIERELEAARPERAPAPEPDPRIREAQKMLAQLGFDPGPADGFWGRGTEGAVRAFQNWYPAAKLGATGELDEPTYRAMTEAVSKGMTFTKTPPPPAVATAPAPAPKPKPAPPAPAEVKARPVLKGVPTVLDTSALVIDGQLVRLVGVLGEGGTMAKELEIYIAKRTVICGPEGTNEYHCIVGGQNLSEVVLFNGAGRAKADAPAYLKQAEAVARRNSIGVWR